MWETTTWENSALHITISSPDIKTDKPTLIKLLSPQSPIIDNVATRAKYIWAKDVLKANMNYNIDNIKHGEGGLSFENMVSNQDKSADNDSPEFEQTDVDLMVEKKFTCVSQHSKKPREKITLQYLWDMIKNPMQIKKPGEEPFDIDDGLSNVGSHQEFSMV